MRTKCKLFSLVEVNLLLYADCVEKHFSYLAFLKKLLLILNVKSRKFNFTLWI